MVIKLSFLANVGPKRRLMAVKRKYINVDPKGKGAEGGENVFAKRCTRCDGENKREYLRM